MGKKIRVLNLVLARADVVRPAEVVQSGSVHVSVMEYMRFREIYTELVSSTDFSKLAIFLSFSAHGSEVDLQAMHSMLCFVR